MKRGIHANSGWFKIQAMNQLSALDRLSIISFNTTATDRSNGLKLMTQNKYSIDFELFLNV